MHKLYFDRWQSTAYKKLASYYKWNEQKVVYIHTKKTWIVLLDVYYSLDISKHNGPWLKEIMIFWFWHFWRHNVRFRRGFHITLPISHIKWRSVHLCYPVCTKWIHVFRIILCRLFNVLLKAAYNLQPQHKKLAIKKKAIRHNQHKTCP